MRIACILELADSGAEGGRDVATIQLLEHLSKRGVEVEVRSFAHGIDCPLPRVFRETPILRAVTAIPLCGRKALRDLDGDYDLILISSTSTATLYRPSTPVILYCHGILAHKWDRTELPPHYRLFFNPVSRAVMAWFEKKCVRNVDAVIGVHRKTVGQIDETLHVSGVKTFVLGNGVDTDMFKPGDSRGEGVVFVGRASKNKGYDVLLEAAPHIGSNVTAVISKMRKHLKRQARDSRIDAVMNVPFERMPSIYRGASVFVLPSLDEEHPLVVLEAMACGLPLVVTEIAAAGMISEGEGGFIVPPGDAAMLAEKVNLLLNDEALRRQMGERNRTLVERDFSWEKMAERFLEISAQVIGDG